jgi:hypothetical protein
MPKTSSSLAHYKRLTHKVLYFKGRQKLLPRSTTVVNKRKYSLIYIQQDATLHRLFYLETALGVSAGTCTHHQERIQLYLQHLLFVTLLLLSAAIVEELEPV